MPILFPVKVEKRMQELLEEGLHPKAVLDTLSREFDDKAPSEKTVQRRYNRMRAADPSREWRLADAKPDEDSSFPLEVLATVISRTGGLVTHLTTAQVQWLHRLRRAAPDLPVRFAYRLALGYMARLAKDEDTHELDCFLAFGPWRSTEDQARFEARLILGDVPQISPALRLAASELQLSTDQVTEWVVDEFIERDMPRLQWDFDIGDDSGRNLAALRAALIERFDWQFREWNAWGMSDDEVWPVSGRRAVLEELMEFCVERYAKEDN